MTHNHTFWLELNDSVVCSMPLKGKGLNGEKRYYFDSIAKKCKSFTYKGHGGNQNNFKNKKDCQKACYRVMCKKSVQCANQAMSCQELNHTCHKFPEAVCTVDFCACNKTKFLNPISNEPVDCGKTVKLCSRRLAKYHVDSVTNSSGLMKPKCEIDGSYSPRQCRDKICFCVNALGKELPGKTVHISKADTLICSE